MDEFLIELAGCRVRVRARFPDTRRYFRTYALPDPLPDPAASPCSGAQCAPDIPACSGAQCAPSAASCSGGHRPPASPVPVLPDVAELGEWEWNATAKEGMPASAYTEYTVLTGFVSDALMAADRVIMHAVALRWRDKAWLISAPSGTGKSTQFKHLNALRPGEFTVICGDRPVLSFHDNEIIVHPSPWNGKESWHGADAAPLGGIILLRRGEENRLEAAQPREIALEIYAQFIQSCREPDKIRWVADMETRMLDAVPLWRLTTNTVPDSTRLLLESVFSE